MLTISTTLGFSHPSWAVIDVSKVGLPLLVLGSVPAFSRLSSLIVVVVISISLVLIIMVVVLSVVAR